MSRSKIAAALGAAAVMAAATAIGLHGWAAVERALLVFLAAGALLLLLAVALGAAGMLAGFFALWSDPHDSARKTSHEPPRPLPPPAPQAAGSAR